MKRILLFCSAGMSTSLLVTKMREAAKEGGIDVSVDAYPEAEMAKHLGEVDVVLLGPQIRYALGRATKMCGSKNIPLAVINSMDYGMMDGKKVLNQAMKLMESKGRECNE